MPESERNERRDLPRWVSGLVICSASLASAASLIGWYWSGLSSAPPLPSPSELRRIVAQGPDLPPYFQLNPTVRCWSTFPPEIAQLGTRDDYSNIQREDYVRPEGCQKCHREQFERWRTSAHAKMNADADNQTVLGDFDDKSLALQGGLFTMTREGDERFMRMQKGNIDRTFRITRTIGSRVVQFYVAKQSAGSPLRSGPGADAPEDELIMPVGYWITRKKWIPAYDVFDFVDQDQPQSGFDLFENFQAKAYYQHCTLCHTTIAEGLRLLWDTYPPPVGKPQHHVEAEQLIAPLFAGIERPLPHPDARMRTYQAENELLLITGGFQADQTVALGISCEACHLGGRIHASEGAAKPPRFAASSPHVRREGEPELGFGRTPQNINLTCGRCHSAKRELLPCGASSKNSAEFRDGLAGHCYSQMKCTHCHDPHGETNSSPVAIESACLNCHQQLAAPAARAAHTRHSAGSEGDRCVSCHMPRITEGLESLTRTHQITSPTEAQFEKGDVNACNLCHLDRSHRWTLNNLSLWYGSQFNLPAIATAWKSLERPAGWEYVESDNKFVRRIGVATAGLRNAKWLAVGTLRELDSPELIHRQFAQDALETLLEKDLSQAAGYQFWQTPREREVPLQKLRALAEQLAEKTGGKAE